MYPGQYKGLGLPPEDLTKYDSPAQQVALPVEVEGQKENVHFIVVHSYSPYTAILECPRSIPWV